MNEMGYFIGLFDIEEPIVYKVTFDNPDKVYLGHLQEDGEPPSEFSEDLQPGSHRRILVGNFNLAVFKIKVEIFDIDGNLKAKKRFTNIPGQEGEELDAE